jgi:hypothetical protein
MAVRSVVALFFSRSFFLLSRFFALLATIPLCERPFAFLSALAFVEEIICMSRRNLFWLLSVATISLFGLAVSYSAPTREKDKDYELVRLLVDVLHEVRQRYVVDVTPDRERKLVEDMINGGLERLDPHSQYINPNDYKQFDKHSEGKFGGIGVQVGYDRQKGGQLTIISPMVGTPAYEAGILAGDVITKIDDKPTESMRMSEAIDMIQGEPGSKITLTIIREGLDKGRSSKSPVFWVICVRRMNPSNGSGSSTRNTTSPMFAWSTSANPLPPSCATPSRRWRRTAFAASCLTCATIPVVCSRPLSRSAISF